MIRKSIIKKNINTSEIYHIIGHNGSVFLKLFFRNLLILVLLILVFLLLDRYISRSYLSLIFAILWILVFIKFCIDFFNIYLDSLVMTNTGLILYLREWLLEYHTEFFDRERIESISYNQIWIWDKMFFKGNITIKLEHGIEFPFENVSYPKKQAEKILQLKNRFVPKKNIQWDDDIENKKFDILVEALWEVVKDYMEKWDKDGEFDDLDYFLD